MVVAENFVLERTDFELDGCRVASYRGGRPGALPLLLMHGVGPGACIGSAFSPIMPFLFRHFHVFAFDFIGFGQSGRKPVAPYFDFQLWLKQARTLIARMPQKRIGVFGHSMSGAIALKLAATEPRVAAVITTGSVGTRLKVNRHLENLWTYPRSYEALRSSLASLIHDPSNVSEAILQERWTVLSEGDYSDYFTEMFKGKQALADTWVISDDELGRIHVPFTLVHGRNDLACPPEETSCLLAKKIPHADLMLLAACGHSPSVEQSVKICAAVRAAFSTVVDFDDA